MADRLMPTPRNVFLEITSRCNMHCRYCYYLDNTGVDYLDLPTRRWLDFFDELGRAKVMGVCLAGAEPLMRPDLFELIDGLVRNRMRFELLTNGMLMTAEKAYCLQQTGRCDYVQVSIDGPNAAVHETMRGEGSFDGAVKAVTLLQEAGVTVTVRATLHEQNIDYLPQLADFLFHDLELPGFTCNAVSRLGDGKKYGSDMLLSPVRRLQAMRTLAELEELYPGRITASAGPLYEWHDYRMMREALAQGLDLPNRGHLTACGCVFSGLAVRSDGAYVPCAMLPQQVLGYIGEAALEDVWLHAPLLNAVRGRRKIPLRTFERCSDCQYNSLCTGNCPGTAFGECGDSDQPCREGCLKLFEEELQEEGVSLWQ